MNSIIYIATDRAYAGRFRIYGGYNIYPNMARMSNSGTIYNNAISSAGSTLMCHASEWTGRYTWDLHKDISYSKRTYSRQIPFQDSIFTDLINKGYECHLVLVQKRPGKCYDSFKPVYNLWPKEVKINLIKDWDVPGGEKNTRHTQFEKINEIIKDVEGRGKKAFVWMKCHGFYQWEQRAKYVFYAGQRRPTKEDVYNAEIDESLGWLIDQLDYKNPSSPDIWFGSDHGSWIGENMRLWYGYHLNQEIVHVPLISSKGNGREVDSVFSMRKLRWLLQDHYYNLGEDYIYAETLFPGQISNGPGKDVNSMAKIMVRMGRFKYIYSRYGIDGMSENPYEELYDIAYDPREKANLVDILTKRYYDISRSDISGKKMTHLASRISSSDIEIEKTKNFSGKVNDSDPFVDSLNEGGWKEISSILNNLRSQARKIWKNTGRAGEFKL